MKKFFITGLIFTCVTIHAQQRVESYPLSSVQLLDGDGCFSKWSDNQRLDSAWMCSFPVRRLLHNFRTTAGAYSALEGGYSGKQKVEKLGGWESMDCDLRGHAIGHLLSAYALMATHSSNGKWTFADGQNAVENVKSDNIFRLKGDSLVAGLRVCQQTLGTGYISAFPEGLLKRNLRGTSVWAPWYTIHKIIAGLLLQYTLCGNETALEICKDFSKWTSRFLSEDNLKKHETPQGNPEKEKLPCHTTDAVRQRALRNEFGGIGESFYQLYGITHDEATLKNAQFFYHNEKLDPLYAGNYDMGTQHCNTFLPKMAAEIKSYELGLPVNPHAADGGTVLDDGNVHQTTRQQNDKTPKQQRTQLKMVDGFWHAMIKEHVLAPGCLSDKEHFFDPKQTSKHLTGNTGETCCTYNMLKLTRELYSMNPHDPQYFDYFERALYNHILGQQDPQTGMVHYFLPTQTGAYKLYSTYDKSFWCCVGSSFESHAKYGESIYWHNTTSGRDTVYVNLFIPSELNVEGLNIKMKTEFPQSDIVSLSIETKKPLVLMLRQPSWTWKKGYKAISVKAGKRNITYRLPMSLHTEATPDDPLRIALFYGPVLLAGQLGNVENPFSNPANHNDYYGFDYKVPASLKTVPLDVKSLKHTNTLEWQTKEGIKVCPLYDTHRERYVIYWNKK